MPQASRNRRGRHPASRVPRPALSPGAGARRPADAHRAAASAAAGGELQTSFVGNFEAASGPAYGVLLDDLLPGWRRQVRGASDLGDLLASATHRPPTTDVAKAAARYDGAKLRT